MILGIVASSVEEPVLVNKNTDSSRTNYQRKFKAIRAHPVHTWKARTALLAQGADTSSSTSTSQVHHHRHHHHIHISRPMADGFIILGGFLALIALTGITSAVIYWLRRRRMSTVVNRSTKVSSSASAPSQEYASRICKSHSLQVPRASKPGSGHRTTPSSSSSFLMKLKPQETRQRWLAGWWFDNLRRNTNLIHLPDDDLPPNSTSHNGLGLHSLRVFGPASSPSPSPPPGPSNSYSHVKMSSTESINTQVTNEMPIQHINYDQDVGMFVIGSTSEELCESVIACDRSAPEIMVTSSTAKDLR